MLPTVWTLMRLHPRTILPCLILATVTACGTSAATSAPTSTTTTTTSTTTATTLPPPTTTVPVAPPTTVPRRSAPTGAPAPTAAPQAATTSPADDPRCPPEVVAIIHRYFDRFGTDVASAMTRIAWRESNCRPDVTSPTGCAGTFQLAVPLHADLFAALGYDWHSAAWQTEPNVAAAALLYSGSGMSPWRL